MSTYFCPECQHEELSDVPVNECKKCGWDDLLEICPMCGSEIDTDTKVCPECKETVA